jgi:hypothetical protein
MPRESTRGSDVAKQAAKAAGKKFAAKVALWAAGAIGCGTIGIGLVVMLAVFVAFTFFYGLFTTSGGTVRVGPGEQMVGSPGLVRANQALRNTYVKAADAVSLTGLSASQSAQVEAQQVDLPASVLLALGKVETDYRPTDAQAFASHLAPVYTWDRLYDLTCVTRSVHVGRGAGYHGGSWSIRRTLTRVWALLAAIPSTTGCTDPVVAFHIGLCAGQNLASRGLLFRAW